MASNVQKNISELAVSLLHLQQNIAIPEINLPVHPVISDSVALATREDKKPMELMTKYLSDTTVLNALQKQVANWTKDIRKVSHVTVGHMTVSYYNDCSSTIVLLIVLLLMVLLIV